MRQCTTKAAPPCLANPEPARVSLKDWTWPPAPRRIAPQGASRPLPRPRVDRPEPAPRVMNGSTIPPQSALLCQPQRLLLALLLWQCSVWVLVPLFGYTMLPLDSIEAVAWGKEWQWGYYKHPPLGAWLAQAAVRLTGGWLGAVYLLAQLVLAATLIYVWKIARLFLDAPRAAIATTLLAGSYFHTVLIPNFNMNSLQLPLWAGLCYHLLRVLEGRRSHWWAFALCAALALLSKYSSLLLLATCAGLLLATAQGRQAMRCRQFWLAGLLGLAVLAPHLHWLLQSDFLPIRYIESFQAQGEASAAGHLLEPLRFALGSLLSLLGSALLFLLVFDRRAQRPRVGQRDVLLLLLFMGPLLLTMAYGVYSGSRLKTTWAFPYFSLVGVVLLRFLPTRVDAAAMQRFALGLAAMCLLVLGLHVAYKVNSERSKTRFDGEALALTVNQAWRQQHASALPVVAGDHVITAIIAGYAPDHPAMLIDGDFDKSPWLQAADLRRGLVVVCEGSDACLPELVSDGRQTRLIEIGGRQFTLRLLPPRS